MFPLEHPELLPEPALLAFADDLAVLASSRQALGDVSARIRDNALRFGLRLSPKTNFMVVSRRTEDPAHGDALQVGLDSFERVETFKYLGVLIDHKNSLDPEIRARCLAGLRTFHSLAPHLRSKKVSVHAKVRLFETIERPAVLYGAEAWTLTKEREARIAVAETRALRRAVGPKHDEEADRYVWRSNEECRQRTGVVPILNKARKRRLQYAGHIARGSAPPATRAMLNTTGHQRGARPRGSPRKRLFDQVARDARSLQVADWREAAQHRDAWRASTFGVEEQPDPYEAARQAAKRRKAEREAARDAARQLDLGDPG